MSLEASQPETSQASPPPAPVPIEMGIGILFPSQMSTSTPPLETHEPSDAAADLERGFTNLNMDEHVRRPRAPVVHVCGPLPGLPPFFNKREKKMVPGVWDLVCDLVEEKDELTVVLEQRFHHNPPQEGYIRMVRVVDPCSSPGRMLIEGEPTIGPWIIVAQYEEASLLDTLPGAAEPEYRWISRINRLRAWVEVLEHIQLHAGMRRAAYIQCIEAQFLIWGRQCIKVAYDRAYDVASRRLDYSLEGTAYVLDSEAQRPILHVLRKLRKVALLFASRPYSPGDVPSLDERTEDAIQEWAADCREATRRHRHLDLLVDDEDSA